jgi:hypothetical protein
VLILFAGVVFGYNSNSWTPPIFDTSCSFTRDDVFNALKKYVDVNPKDNQITKMEINGSLDKYLPWYIPKWPLVGSVDSILTNCDYDKNGVITARDFMLSAESCLPFKKNWCTVQWFYDNIENKNLGK